MALTEITNNGSYRIKRVAGDAKVRRHLENLGFIPGEKLDIVSNAASGLIISIKGCRIAINRETAALVMV